jgi:polyisoprenoid-binding protein YceI
VNSNQSTRTRRAFTSFLLLPVLLLLGAAADPPTSGGKPANYAIDQRYGHIGFSVSHLHLFRSHGEFRRFAGTLSIDPGHLEHTQIAVTVDASSVDMPSQDATKTLQSADFFDVQQFPRVTFTSASVSTLPDSHYQIHGMIRIRGIEKPLVLDAELVNRRQGGPALPDQADFVVAGQIKRSDFGMTAEKLFISDRVDLRIQVRIQLAG